MQGTALVRAQSASTIDDTQLARVIVRFRVGSSLLGESGLSATAAPAARAAALGLRLALPMSAGVAVSDRSQVVFAAGVTSAELAERLAKESDVEYAVPDERRRIVTAPGDPLYAAGVPGNGPATGQWYLRAPSGEVQSSLNVEEAWAATTGSPGLVVAVVDTGVRFEHPDLLSVAVGGNLLPGYDMVSDAAAANDGDGRDADASDPGDWVTWAEISQPGSSLFRCATSPENSSWHGTQLSGLIAALTDNGIGMAGAAPSVRVLPVRVLGKCGGYDSDIIAGMRWAAGLSVPDTPGNPYPARVINLSLGGDGACSAAYQQAVDEITAAGLGDRGRRRELVGARRRPAGQLRWRDRGRGAAPRGHQGRLLLPGPRGGDQRPRGQLRQHGSRLSLPVPHPHDDGFGRNRAGQLDLYRQLQHFGRDQLLGAARRRGRRADAVGPPNHHTTAGQGAAAGHSAPVPTARDHPLQQRGASVHRSRSTASSAGRSTSRSATAPPRPAARACSMPRQPSRRPHREQARPSKAAQPRAPPIA